MSRGLPFLASNAIAFIPRLQLTLKSWSLALGPTLDWFCFALPIFYQLYNLSLTLLPASDYGR